MRIAAQRGTKPGPRSVDFEELRAVTRVHAPSAEPAHATPGVKELLSLAPGAPPRH